MLGSILLMLLHTLSSTAPFSISWSMRLFKAAHTCDNQHNNPASWCWLSFGKTPPVILVNSMKNIQITNEKRKKKKELIMMKEWH